ncbi:aldose epimerase family protein [Salsuginibacillus kocurii]|uniref:aldose epimerase family protein n=1 Tax=Salsuginibacillus kocurii TaxID=427078 RepID=UPI0003645625|nr:aldose epimerase family protein [Salsuginibacillus kocurii]
MISKNIVSSFNGIPVTAYTMENSNGMKVKALDYGCVILEILVPDQEGNVENVVLRYDEISMYEKNPGFLGAIIGRTAGRTQDGKLPLTNHTYYLQQNEGKHHLHGGYECLSHVHWNVITEIQDNEQIIYFHYTSKEGEGGYPGKVDCYITYRLDNTNKFIIEYKAVTDKETAINFTNHSYFNLSGNAKRTIENHDLEIDSERFLELTHELIPTGEVLEVGSHPAFDFRKSKKIKDSLSQRDEQIKRAGGIDHPFIINQAKKKAVVLFDEKSGRKLEIETDDPAIVCYSGNQLTGNPPISNRKAIKHLGICLEAQQVPNSYFLPDFEPPIIKATETYYKKTVFSFSNCTR